MNSDEDMGWELAFSVTVLTFSKTIAGINLSSVNKNPTNQNFLVQIY